ncbi:hypothetical protein LTR95_015161 [Oleoguttula sp. CCFEE 5521]
MKKSHTVTTPRRILNIRENPNMDLSSDTVASPPNKRDTLHIALDALGDAAGGGSICILPLFSMCMISYGFVKYTLLLRKGIRNLVDQA